MARSTLKAGVAIAALWLTALPLAAQDQSAPPVVSGTEAPAQPGSPTPPATEAAPALPGAEAAPALPSVATEGAATAIVPDTTAPVASVAEGGAAAGTTAPDIVPAVPGSPAVGAGPAVAPPAVAPPAVAQPAPGDHGPAAGPAGGPAASTLPHDLSPWGMFMAADYVVKGVMLGLAFATFVSLTVLVYKFFEIAWAKHALRRTTKVIRNSTSLPDAATALKGRRDPASFITLAALDELRKSEAALDVSGNDGVKERTHSIVERTEAQAGRHLMRGTGLLATIGSTAPFVGLFGTVWGIMNSFIGISRSNTTNLAVVAPGIAEALLATAIGLVAAIPAVIIYNHFARQIQGYRLALGDAGAGVERLLSRDLDFRGVTGA